MQEDPRLGSRGNELFKRLIEKRPYGTATAAFVEVWEGSSRVPKIIHFPGGLERAVGYMRDGILTFQDGREPSATYERILDHPSEVKAIIVYYPVNDPSICN